MHLLQKLTMLVLWHYAASQTDCNGTLAKPVRHEDHPLFRDLSEEQFQSVMRCPADIDCCSDGTLSCYNWKYLTCSCSDDCEEYGDCCWHCEDKVADAALVPPNPKWVCTSVSLEGSVTKHVFFASRCNALWPLQDDVREQCEDVNYSPSEVYYSLPVTSNQSLVTYRNAFCAFCNYDLDEVTFWDVVLGNTSKPKLRPPLFISMNFYDYLRQCSKFPLIGYCPEETSPVITSSCRTFFAPIVDETSYSVFYKNAYCAHCHGVNLTAFSCSPAEKTTNKTGLDVKVSSSFPELDLSSIFRTVAKTHTCFSAYEGVCYIDALIYRYVNASDTGPSTAAMIRGYLTAVCISVSLVCLILKLVVYLFSKECRTFSSRCILCLSMTLFFAHALFLVFNLVDFGHKVCVASSVLIHFAFLSTAFWTTVLAYDIWKTLILVRRPAGDWRSFLRYTLAGWGSPCLVVGMASIVNWTWEDSPLSPSYGEPRCFINNRWGHIFFFLAPMLLLLFVDIAFYVHTVYTIRRTEAQSHKYDFKADEKPSRILLFVKLAFIMGVSWLLGLVSGLVNSLVMDCVSIAFVGLQGVFLFFGFRDHRHVYNMVSSTSMISGLLSHSRSRSSTTATTDVALSSQMLALGNAQKVGASGKVSTG